MNDADQKVRQQLIAEIEETFANVKRGNGITLHQARVLDDYWHDPEREAEARKKDTDTRWQDIPEKWIETLGDDLTFIDDPEGFRYYLPAFMIYSLSHYETSDYVAVDEVAFVLGNRPTDTCTLHRCSLLSPQQLQAVAHFLRWYASIVPDDSFVKCAKDAIEAHWHQFL